VPTPANCTVRVSGRNKNNNNNNNSRRPGARYGPFDFNYSPGIVEGTAKPLANMTRYTLPPLAGELTDLLWEIVSVTGGDVEFGAMSLDNFEYDLVAKK
jgi:hypothetical protein